MAYIFGSCRASLPYRWVWCLMITSGALLSSDVAGIKFIWNLADTMNGAMAIPNVVGLLGLSLLVYRGTRAYFGRESSSSRPDRQIRETLCTVAAWAVSENIADPSQSPTA